MSLRRQTTTSSLTTLLQPLHEFCKSTTYPIFLSHIMTYLTCLLNNQPANPDFQQAQIGWNNLLYGIFDNEWILLHNKKSNNYKGSQIVTQLIGLIFEAITRWKTRNNQLHNTTPDSNELRSRLITRTRTLCDCLPNVLAQDWHLFNLPLQELITKSTQKLK